MFGGWLGAPAWRAGLQPRHRLDVSVRDLLFGLSACAWAARSQALEDGVARAFGREEDALVCLSVRSGFDLLLGVLEEPAGGEVLVSAITHPDMVRIIEAHGLRAVPVDLDASTLAPRTGAMEEEISPRTRMVLVAHLFGGRFDLRPVAAFARERGLLLVEDCAQAFGGPGDTGDSLADVSMFSFGRLKTATAVGGAILGVRDPRLLDRMRRTQEAWPAQSRRSYAAGLLKTLCLVLLCRPLPYGALARACGLLGREFDDVVNGAVRAFPPSGGPSGGSVACGLLARIRRRPGAPLLALLARRLRTFDGARLARRTGVGDRAARSLSAVVGCPGEGAPTRTHWLFPVAVPDPASLVRALRRSGFDASRATSNLAPVAAPPEAPSRRPEEAERLMSRLVYLPVYPEMPDGELRRLTDAVRRAVLGSGGRL